MSLITPDPEIYYEVTVVYKESGQQHTIVVKGDTRWSILVPADIINISMTRVKPKSRYK